MAKRKKLPTTTISQSRLCLFHASKKFLGPAEKLIFENELGEVTIKNSRLTQIHRSILDVVFTNLDPLDPLDGTTDVRFSTTSYEILKALGSKSTGNYSWLRDKLEDLQLCLFTIKSKELGFKREVSFTIINRVELMFDERTNKESLIVEISKDYLEFMSADRRVFYPSLVSELCALKYAETQALARLFLSHDSFNREFSFILKEIGITKENGWLPAAISRAKKNILSEKDTLLEKFGIRIGDDSRNPIIYYKKKAGVWTEKGNQEQLSALNDRTNFMDEEIGEGVIDV